MTTNTLYTVQEVARLLHVSDDTVRRQIREGDLEAVRIGTTPKGRPRYRIAAEVVEQKLGQSSTAPSALERLRELFAGLDDADREELLQKAIHWARERTLEPESSQGEVMSKEDLAGHLTPRGKALLDAARKE